MSASEVDFTSHGPAVPTQLDVAGLLPRTVETLAMLVGKLREVETQKYGVAGVTIAVTAGKVTRVSWREEHAYGGSS